MFSSINYGTDDSPEGRIVIEQTLNAVDEGLGDGSTAIFPISVFRVKEGINFSEEDWELAKNNWEDAVTGKLTFKTPNFDLFIKACVVSSHRLFPNFVNASENYVINNLTIASLKSGTVVRAFLNPIKEPSSGQTNGHT